MPVLSAAPLRFIALTTAATLALGLAACGGPRDTSNTIDALIIERGAVVGASKDVPPGTRALNAGVPKNLGQLEGEVSDTLFGNGGKTKLTGYLNGIKPTAGPKERAYAGDRAGYLVRDVSDPAAVPSAIVGLFPAPFSTRFTPKRRLMPTLVQCVDGASVGCRGVLRSLAKAKVRAGALDLRDSSTTTALRIFVGTWAQLRPTLAKGRLAPALAVEGEPERNGYGLQIARNGATVLEGARFGEAASPGSFGPGTGVVFAARDTIGSTFWVVTGTDEAGVRDAALSLDADALDGRVAAIVPAR